MEFLKTKKLIEMMVASKIVPGVNYLIFKNNDIWQNTVGLSQIIPQPVPLKADAIYDLASLTKVIGTTNVLLKLADEGKIAFNDALKMYLPEFLDKRVKLSDLLTHTSGIKGWIANRDQLNARELLQAIINLPVTEEFEHKVRYADTNFILLGLVLEKIYQQDLQDIIMHEVIKPAGLKATSFAPDANKTVPTAMNQQGIMLCGVVHDPKARVLGKSCGSAGLFSNIADLYRLAQGYVGLRDDILPFGSATLSELYKIKTPAKLHARSWGWDLCFDPSDHHTLIYHTGFTGTFMLLDKVKKTGLIVLTNRIYPSGHNLIFLKMRQKIIESFLLENSII
ncbi:beta-lactamase [Lactobacillus iners UPII 143-D]|uniref:serine hydrolase domain-containing protein n=1 Tax=Lactobacillus iners TaxID=147802 RepID=UPI0001FD79A2|nr:serine hydrolase domain-containing protein [Lactobacillus iners]EGC79584.1 beta-lactamase [Lactobacillus iners UPII 143-D]